MAGMPSVSVTGVPGRITRKSLTSDRQLLDVFRCGLNCGVPEQVGLHRGHAGGRGLGGQFHELDFAGVGVESLGEAVDLVQVGRVDPQADVAAAGQKRGQNY